MKKGNVSSILKGVGIAMAIGGATALVGSAVVPESKFESVKKSALKALKSIEKML